MSRLVVVTTPELLPDYRLAGTAAVAVESSEEAAAKLKDLLDGRDAEGVIAIHEPFYREFDRETRANLEKTYRPLVLALPAGGGDAEDDGRRERYLRMLWQAVGYEITFDSEGG